MLARKAGPGYDLRGVWQQYAPDVRGHALPTGQFVPEEAPDLVVDALRDFLDSRVRLEVLAQPGVTPGLARARGTFWSATLMPVPTCGPGT